MKSSVFFAAVGAAVLLLIAPCAPSAAKPVVCAECVKANMQRLAGDELHGRGCGSEDEHAAARFLGEALRQSKISPAFGDGVYLQAVQLQTPTAAAVPKLEIVSGNTHLSFLQGQDIVAIQPPETLRAATLYLTDAKSATEAIKGKVVIYDSAFFDQPGIQALLGAGALAVISPLSDQNAQHWNELSTRSPGRTRVVGVESPEPAPIGATIYATPQTMAALRHIGQGEAQLTAPRGEPRARTTYNVMGVLHGKASDADHHALLLTAHYDHLGVRNSVTFHGANDDASGTAAVLEFARILGQSARHRRTVYFGLFGCEEEGELGAQYIQAHAPMAISDLMANLEFEMIGVDDPKRPGALMLTGWERTNLGPALQAQGARLGPDLYPQQHFFRRSDNYQLARRGVIAQTVSAWPLPPTYHAASDDLAHVDLAFMNSVITSMVKPVTWLLDSDFQPQWLPGQKP